MLVLQERGGLLACMADSGRKSETDCRNSQRAHRQFAALAKTRGIRWPKRTALKPPKGSAARPLTCSSSSSCLRVTGSLASAARLVTCAKSTSARIAAMAVLDFWACAI